MKQKKYSGERAIALFSIYLMVSLTFASASAMAYQPDELNNDGLKSFAEFAIEVLDFLMPGVSAQESCCIKTENLDYCRDDVSSADCDVSLVPGKCTDISVPECQIGTCVQENGDCDANYHKQRCDDAGGFWSSNSLLEIPACTPTCCVLKDEGEIVDSEFVFFRNKCEKLPAVEDEGLDFEERELSYTACKNIVPPLTKGYCTVEAEAFCIYTTKEDCDGREGEFDNKKCASCIEDYDQECFNGEQGYGVYNFDSCGGPGTILTSCGINQICEEDDNGNVACEDKVCSLDIEFTNLGYNTAHLKSRQVEVQVKEGIAEIVQVTSGAKSFTLTQSKQACVRMQGPGEQHYKATCVFGELLTFGVDDTREKICAFGNGRTYDKDNDYEPCNDAGQSKHFFTGSQGYFSKAMDFMGADLITPKWWDYNVINPGISDESSCKAMGTGDCINAPNNDCVPKYPPANSDRCHVCSTTEASSPWDKCGELEQCQSRGYCKLVEYNMHPLAGVTICTIQTLAQQAVASAIAKFTDASGIRKYFEDLRNGIAKNSPPGSTHEGDDTSLGGIQDAYADKINDWQDQTPGRQAASLIPSLLGAILSTPGIIARGLLGEGLGRFGDAADWVSGTSGAENEVNDIASRLNKPGVNILSGLDFLVTYFGGNPILSSDYASDINKRISDLEDKGKKAPLSDKDQKDLDTYTNIRDRLPAATQSSQLGAQAAQEKEKDVRDKAEKDAGKASDKAKQPPAKKEDKPKIVVPEDDEGIATPGLGTQSDGDKTPEKTPKEVEDLPLPEGPVVDTTADEMEGQDDGDAPEAPVRAAEEEPVKDLVGPAVLPPEATGTPGGKDEEGDGLAPIPNILEDPKVQAAVQSNERAPSTEAEKVLEQNRLALEARNAKALADLKAAQAAAKKGDVSPDVVKTREQTLKELGLRIENVDEALETIKNKPMPDVKTSSPVNSEKLGDKEGKIFGKDTRSITLDYQKTLGKDAGSETLTASYRDKGIFDFGPDDRVSEINVDSDFTKRKGGVATWDLDTSELRGYDIDEIPKLPDYDSAVIIADDLDRLKTPNGYSYQDYFNKAIREQYGVNPGQVIYGGSASAQNRVLYDLLTSRPYLEGLPNYYYFNMLRGETPGRSGPEAFGAYVGGTLPAPELAYTGARGVLFTLTGLATNAPAPKKGFKLGDLGNIFGQDFGAEPYHGGLYNFPTREEKGQYNEQYKDSIMTWWKAQGEIQGFLLHQLQSYGKTLLIGLIISTVASQYQQQIQKLSMQYWMKQAVCYSLTGVGVPASFGMTPQQFCDSSRYLVPILTCSIQTYLQTNVLANNACIGVSASQMPGIDSGFANCEVCHLDDFPCTSNRCSTLSSSGYCVFDSYTRTCFPSESALKGCSGTSSASFNIEQINSRTVSSTSPFVKDDLGYEQMSFEVEVKTNIASKCKFTTNKTEGWDNMREMDSDLSFKFHNISLSTAQLDRMNFTYFAVCQDSCRPQQFSDIIEISIQKLEKPDEIGPIVVKKFPEPDTPIEGGEDGKKEIIVRIETDEDAECKWKRYPLAEGIDSFVGEIEEIERIASNLVGAGASEQTLESELSLTGLRWDGANLTHVITDEDFVSEHKVEFTGDDALNNSEIYAYVFLCRDRQGNLGEIPGIVRFKVSDEFDVDITEPKDTTIESKPDLRVSTDRLSVCRYSVGNKLAYSQMDSFATTSRMGHRTVIQDLLSFGEHTVFVSCLDEEGFNIASDEKTFAVIRDTAAPRIVRAYKDGGTLLIATDELTSCQYSFKRFGYGDGSEMTGNTPVDVEHRAEWRAETTYYIACRDRFGNSLSTSMKTTKNN